MLVQSLGPELAASAVRYDAAIAYLGASYGTQETNDLFAALETATIAAQKACHDAQLTCAVVDPTAIGDAALARYPLLIIPSVPGAPAFTRRAAAIISRYGEHGVIMRGAGDAGPLLAAFRATGHRRIVEGLSDATFARDTTGTLDGFLTVTNYASTEEDVPAGASVAVSERRRVTLPAFTVPAHNAIVVPIDLPLRVLARDFPSTDELLFTDCIPTAEGSPESQVYFSAFQPGAGMPSPFWNHCNLRARVSGRIIDQSCYWCKLFAFESDGAQLSAPPLFATDEPTPEPTGLPVRDDARLPGIDPSTPPAGTAVVSTGDVFRDGSQAVTFDNGLVRLIVSPDAGARAFVFEDDATRRNIFTSVGGMRDDVAVEPPLSTTDRIAKYTHQFPAGMFNRPYTASIAQSATTAAATFAYDAPDVLPHGATFTRTVSMRPSERAFELREHVDDKGAATDDPQRAVSVTSLSVGDTSKPMTTQRILAPEVSNFTAETTFHVQSGHAFGYYDSATGELATVAWHAGDIADAAILEQDHSIVVRLTFAASDARVRFGYENATSPDDAAHKLSEAEAAAQAP
jgi:hypothetical protein